MVCSHCGKVRQFLKKLTRITILPSNSNPKYIPKRIKKRDSNRYSKVKRKLLTYPKGGNNSSAQQQMNKQNVVADTYSGILCSHKKNEVLIHAITWMSLENTM